MTADFYIITSDLGYLGMGVSDAVYTLDDAADELGEAEKLTRQDARAIYVDVASGTCRDVTVECLAVIAKRHAGRGYYAEAAE
jgi:hypothetical protein